MKTARLFAAVGTVIGVCVVTAPMASADVTIPILPNQAFHGLVNGLHDKAQITVICPGPSQTGHPAAGQTISVAQGTTSSGVGGFTGKLGTSVEAGFTSSVIGPLFRFTAYNAPQAIPTTISLPCGGSDIISFVPQPTSDTAKSDQFPVTFVNVGA